MATGTSLNGFTLQSSVAKIGRWFSPVTLRDSLESFLSTWQQHLMSWLGKSHWMFTFELVEHICRAYSTIMTSVEHQQNAAFRKYMLLLCDLLLSLFRSDIHHTVHSHYNAASPACYTVVRDITLLSAASQLSQRLIANLDQIHRNSASYLNLAANVYFSHIWQNLKLPCFCYNQQFHIIIIILQCTGVTSALAKCP